jgi:hypothetical protein
VSEPASVAFWAPGPAQRGRLRDGRQGDPRERRRRGAGALQPPGADYFDHEARAAVTEIAERVGVGRLVALDLYTEFERPTCWEQTL